MNMRLCTVKYLPRVFSFRLAIVGPDHVELQLVTDLEFEKETKTARYALEFAEQRIGGDVTNWGTGRVHQRGRPR